MPFDPAVTLQSFSANPKSNLTAGQFARLTSPSPDKKNRFSHITGCQNWGRVFFARLSHAFQTGTFYTDGKLTVALDNYVTTLPPNAPTLDTAIDLFESLNAANQGKLSLLQQKLDANPIPYFILKIQNTHYDYLTPYYKDVQRDSCNLERLIHLAIDCYDDTILDDILTDFTSILEQNQSILKKALQVAISKGSLEKTKLLAEKMSDIDISIVRFAIHEKKEYQIANTLIAFYSDDEMRKTRQEELLDAMVQRKEAPSQIRELIENFDIPLSLDSKAITDYYLDLITDQDYQGAINLLLTEQLDERAFIPPDVKDIVKLMLMLENKNTEKSNRILMTWREYLENSVEENFPNARLTLENAGWEFLDDPLVYPILLSYFLKCVTDATLLTNALHLCGVDTEKKYRDALNKLDPKLDPNDQSILHAIVVLSNSSDVIESGKFTASDFNSKNQADKSCLQLVVEYCDPPQLVRERIIQLISLGADPFEMFWYGTDIGDYIGTIDSEKTAIEFTQKLLDTLSSRIEIYGWQCLGSEYAKYDNVIPGLQLASKHNKCHHIIRKAMLLELLGSKLDKAFPKLSMDEIYHKLIYTPYNYSRTNILRLALSKGNIELAKDYVQLIKINSGTFDENLVEYHEIASEAVSSANKILCREILKNFPVDSYMLHFLNDLPSENSDLAEEILQDNKFKQVLEEEYYADLSNVLHTAIKKGWNGAAAYLIKTKPELLNTTTMHGIYPAHYLLNPRNIPIWQQFKDHFVSLKFKLNADPEVATIDIVDFFNYWIQALTSGVPLTTVAFTETDFQTLLDQQNAYLSFCKMLLDSNGEAKNEIVCLFNDLSNNNYTLTQFNDFKKGINLKQFLHNANFSLLALLLMRMGSTEDFTINEFTIRPSLILPQLMPLVVLGGFKIYDNGNDKVPFMWQTMKSFEEKSVDDNNFVPLVYGCLKNLIRYYTIEEIDKGLREENLVDLDNPTRTAWDIILDNAPAEDFTDWIPNLTAGDKSLLSWAEETLSQEAKEEYYVNISNELANEVISSFRTLQFIGSINYTRPEYREKLVTALGQAIEGGYPQILQDIMNYTEISPKKVIALFIKQGWSAEQVQQIVDLLNITWQIKSTRKANLLHVAAAAGNISVFKKLLDSGLSIESLDSKSNSLLVTAARNGQEEIIDLILAMAQKRSLDLNVSFSLKKAQHEATKRGYDSIAQKLNDLS